MTSVEIATHDINAYLNSELTAKNFAAACMNDFAVQKLASYFLKRSVGGNHFAFISQMQESIVGMFQPDAAFRRQWFCHALHLMRTMWTLGKPWCSEVR
jgi:hypothetical protein